MRFIIKSIAFFFAALFPLLNPAIAPKTETAAQMIERTYAECVGETVGYSVVAEYAPDGEYEGIEAVTFDGFDIDGKKTKLFAYLAFPDGADENTPGVVLVHGGGGHAYLPWVKQWLDRGYAVIAPDVTGYFPIEAGAGESEADMRWTHSLCSVFAEDGHTVIPDNDGMAHSSDAPERQWMYHAVGAVIRSFSILSQSGRADENKIGAVGVSWGAVITSLYIGYDSRPAFAVPIYGSAYLGDALSYMGGYFSEPETKKLWSAEDRLDKVTCPVLWLCSDCDGNFSVNSNCASYLLTAGNEKTRLSIVNSFRHSHGCAWEREEPFVFADSMVNGGKETARFLTYPTAESAECEVSGGSRARLYYITEEMTYSLADGNDPLSTMPDQAWIKASLDLNGGKITGEIPPNAVMYYISVTENGCTVSTPVVKR